ncbi:Probable L,D-transpeptidase ErfK/SrfK precursor [Megamonas hypermegale]|uniref:Probable L,D-transpeptidase ErfK/SrfK n=1 Tax=Megamonas hypermegale TaxID=158847 RepID=A0A239TRC6_9FIRM|nr:L,D-transpeptidase [Megamonas hypermegale]SNV00082.1 Probable L,D-transpeptidase ErfK/SrfK precursor [Megamonas hypermegale]
MKKIMALFVFLCILMAQAVVFAAENTNTSNSAPVNTVKRWILINIPARSLRLYEDNNCVAMYPVGVGRIETKTPAGFYKIVEKIENPTWVDPGDTSVAISSGPDNPLGYRWLGIGGNYGIHGTNKPSSVGHYVSNGCVRMVEADVEKLFDKVDVGTEVQIMYNRLVIDKTQDGRVAYYIYPDGYNMQNLTVDFVKQGLAGYGIADFVSDDYVAKSIEASNGLPNFVAAPVNLMYNGKKLDFKAVNYQNLTYVPVENLAKTLNTAVKVENNNATTTKGSAAVSLFSKKPYIRLTDISNIFDVNFTLNKNYTVATLTPITANAVQPVEINEVADEKDKQDTTVKQDTVKQNNVNVPKRENSLNAEKELYKSVDTKIKPEQKTIDFEKSVVDNNETDKMELVTVK